MDGWVTQDSLELGHHPIHPKIPLLNNKKLNIIHNTWVGGLRNIPINWDITLPTPKVALLTNQNIRHDT